MEQPPEIKPCLPSSINSLVGITIAPTRDRLSELPDLALVHVLSHLYTHEAARTTILSKRFISLWKSVDTLRFTDKSSANSDFVNLVDTALGFHCRKHLRCFLITCEYDDKLKRNLKHWLKFVVLKQVRTIHLSLRLGKSGRGYNLPSFLCNNAHLEELITCCCNFRMKRVINCSKLKSLSISQTTLSEELISKILRGCSVLETLELRNCKGFDELKIDSPSLRVLRIVGEQFSGNQVNDCVLQISGPNLFSLELLGVLCRTQIRVTDVGNLVNAVLDFVITPFTSYCRNWRDQIVREVLESLCFVKALTLGAFCVEALSRFQVFQDFHPSPPWSERSTLTLSIEVSLWKHLGIADLLHSSPCLETLVIQLVYCSSTVCFWCLGTAFVIVSQIKLLIQSIFIMKLFSQALIAQQCVLEHCGVSMYEAAEEIYWNLQSTISRCPLLHLKTVKIIGFQVSCGPIKPLFQLLRFLLCNAKVLEDVVFQTTRYVTREALDEAQKLVDLETASPDAVVQFEPPHLWIDPLFMYRK